MIEQGGMMVIGDLHITNKEPYRSALELATKELITLVNEYEPNTIVFTGDFFHTGHPLPSEIVMAREFLNGILQGRSVYIVAGNHDYIFKNGQEECALDALSDLAITIGVPGIYGGNQKFFALPFFYRLTGKSVYEYYTEEFLKTIPEKIPVIGHFFSENLSGFPEALKSKIKHIDLSSIRNSNTIILGHDHTPKDEYIGSVIPTEFSPNYPTRGVNYFNPRNNLKEWIPLKRCIEFVIVDELETIDSSGFNLPTYVRIKTKSRADYEAMRSVKVVFKDGSNDVAYWVHSVEYIGEDSKIEVKYDVDFDRATTVFDRMKLYLSNEGLGLPDKVKAKLLKITKEM